MTAYDERIRRTLDVLVPPIVARSRWAEIVTAAADDQSKPSTRTPGMRYPLRRLDAYLGPRRFVLAGLAALVLGGAGAAIGGGLAGWWKQDPPPAAEEMAVFRSERTEADRLPELRYPPGREARCNTTLRAERTCFGVFQFNRSRLALADVSGSGSLYVFPTSEGAGCLAWTSGGIFCVLKFVSGAGARVILAATGDSWQLSVGGSLNEAEASSLQTGSMPQNSVVGLVPDDVVALRVMTADGRAREARIENNAVYVDLAGLCVALADLSFRVAFQTGEAATIPRSPKTPRTRTVGCDRG